MSTNRILATHENGVDNGETMRELKKEARPGT